MKKNEKLTEREVAKEFARIRRLQDRDEVSFRTKPDGSVVTGLIVRNPWIRNGQPKGAIFVRRVEGTRLQYYYLCPALSKRYGTIIAKKVKAKKK